MNEAELEESASFNIELNPSLDLPLNTQTRFNGGYLFLQDIYYELGLNKVCRAISSRHSYNYDLNSILSRLIYTRILFPASKKTVLKNQNALLNNLLLNYMTFTELFLSLQKNPITFKADSLKTAVNYPKEKPV